MGAVREALDASLAVAAHLGAVDAAAVAAAQALADKIDAWDRIVGWALDDLAGDPRHGIRPAVPQNDNTSLGSFLKYCESLGLTPAGRSKLETPKEAPGVGNLGSLQDQARKRRARSTEAAG
ncbi:MAG: terminase small subunit [Rhodoglobus sp.]